MGAGSSFAATVLDALVANVFSGGSINTKHYAPSFALNHRGEDAHVLDALDLVGVDYRIVDDRHERADEVWPTEDGTVLGRVLAVLGAPVGQERNSVWNSRCISTTRLPTFGKRSSFAISRTERQSPAAVSLRFEKNATNRICSHLQTDRRRE
ncbi:MULTISPECIES: hypothetical protein [Natrialbaceae]|uniref:hypothetical protein n=1 Tax=Natrialbaceae TaxID=1644061 RepID=UPI0031F3142F